MPRYLNTTSDPALDRELDDLRALINGLAAKVSASSSAAASVPSVTTVQQTFVVSTADGATVIQAGSIQVTTGSGLTLGQIGDAALLGLRLTAGTGIGIVGDTISNTGVTSVNTLTGAVSISPPTFQSNGTNIGTRNKLNLIAGNGITLTPNDDNTNNRVEYTIAASDVELRASDPGSPRNGQQWFRTDTLEMCLYDGSTVRRSAVYT